MNMGTAQGIACNGVAALFELEDKVLFARAKTVASAHEGSFIEASPLILTGNCHTRPICRHCKWEHFKAVKRDPFILDSPPQQVLDRARELAAAGIGRAFFATGWLGYTLPTRFLHTIAAVREALPHMELYGLFGALDRRTHRDLAAAGLTGMLTGLESPSEHVYRSFRPGGDSLPDRLRSLEYCHEEGLHIWTGFLVGLGESESDIASGIELLARFEPHSISILPFEPYPDTAMANHPPTSARLLARANAVARIALPGVRHFFYDGGSRDFERLYAHKIGMNARYATGAPIHQPQQRERTLNREDVS
jgi:biotin synthase